jgi:nicotinamidase-related amidase/type 1 glutamine amidotransferase
MTLLSSFTNMSAQKKVVDPIRISKQMKVRSTLDEGAWDLVSRIEAWKPAETAIIICDMWDKHWCDDATTRVVEMAPKMNEVLTIARAKGVKIVHAPSECLDYYANYPGRKEAMKYKDQKIAALADGAKLPSETNVPWPVDQSDEGCENAGCKPHKAWSKQIETLTIMDQDLISDSGVEIGAYFQKKGIKNVILMGVHTNMCVIGRSFGLRAMVRMGMNVVLMRDMTDLMYNSQMPPYVNHFTGLDLIVDYIETYVCPTIVSSDFTGKKQFRFKGDTRPRIAFLTAESEYRANQRLPEFAHELALKKNIHCDFALGIPIMNDAKKDADPKLKAEYAAYGMPIDTDGKTFPPTRHNLENLQILEDADLAVFFIRRRALEPEKMQAIMKYITSGKPVIGIRTASHAFAAKGNVPRMSGGIVAAGETTSDLLAQWPEFDEQVLGGNYQGHYGHLVTGTDISIVPGMEGHPLLKGVEPKFNSPNWLYKNRPLRSGKIQVLMLGSNPDVPDEPVAWLHNNNVFYTSLGHWDDWKIESFRNLMLNVVDYLLNK